MKKYKNIFYLLGFCCMAIAFRFFSFFPSVIDHDESTYLCMAKEILHGKLPYVDYIDIKPIGTYLIPAIIQFLAGNSIFVFRLLIACYIGLTAFLIFKVQRKNGSDRPVAASAGIIYIVMISIFTFYGVSISPEIFFNLFVVTGLFFFQSNKIYSYFLGGILMGFGFIVKYFVVFDFIAITGFYILYYVFILKKFDRKIIFNVLFACSGFVLPFFFVNLYYYFIGHYKEFYFITFVAPMNYSVERSGWETIKYVFDFVLRFLPISFLFFFVLFNKSIKPKGKWNNKWFIISWVMLDLIAILLSGKSFGHYFIQLMVPVSYFAGNFFSPGNKISFVHKRKTFTITITSILIFLLLFNALMQKKDYFDKPDYPKKIAAYLKPRLNSDDVLFTGNYHQVLYYLLDKSSPTKYIHRSLLYAAHHIKALNIDSNREFRKIMQSTPAYITLVPDNTFAEDLTVFIQNNYQIDTIFGDNIYIYKRRDSVNNR